MTSKELLYVEDALGHETYFQTQCQTACEQIQSEDLKKTVQSMQKEHGKLFNGLYNLLGE